MPLVDWHPQASRDAIEIYLSISLDSPRAAERFMEAVGDLGTALSSMPRMGRRVTFDRIIGGEVRVITVSNFPNYVLYYRVHSDGIEVLRVVHGKRDQRRFFL